ncbi:hypothetical protein FPV67DRAFT_1463211 [Lyophyllum atratum]|nr:hypothetical protein FPV67DRAFT_1463211 [Lyophyllum atratum]
MAYRDPYAEQPGRLQDQPRYSESSPDYNPYSTSPPHQTYEQGGVGPSYDAYGSAYRDEPQYDRQYPPERSQTMRTHTSAANPGLKPLGTKETNVETGGFPREEKTARTLRNYRYDHQGALWTKGGRGRCFGRVCCCTLMIAVLLFVSIILALALWISPPNITIGDVNTVSKGGSAIQLIENGISVNLGINITVNNPNYFAVNFKQIKAEIFYPINGEKPQIGQGISNNVVFRANHLTNWTFPFAINYRTTDDPQRLILQDLAGKCGVGGPKSNINVDYRITLGLRILFITVSPVVANSLSFMCPLDPADIAPLLKSAGLGA